MKFQIVSDSSCDLGRERAQRLGVTLVSYYVSMDGEHYDREEREIAAQNFYQKMADHPGVFPRTSMPTVEDYEEAFRPFVQRGEAVLCICLNEPFSGSIQSARNAREALLEEFPQANIYVMDSQLATVLQGVLVLEAAHMRDAGCPLEETAAAATGTLLQVKPLIGYAGNGLVSDGIVPGRKRSLARVRELFYRYLERNQLDLRDYYVVTAYGLDEEEYRDFTSRLFQGLEERGYPTEPMGEFHIGVTIGVHTGPTPIGVGILRKEPLGRPVNPSKS